VAWGISLVLQSICDDPQHKQALVQWVQELTPMDAIDFEFPTDQIGRVLVTLVEENGQWTTAYSASDGTLRFLAMIAAWST
jgi:predicted ATPase